MNVSRHAPWLSRGSVLCITVGLSASGENRRVPRHSRPWQIGVRPRYDSLADSSESDEKMKRTFSAIVHISSRNTTRIAWTHRPSCSPVSPTRKREPATLAYANPAKVANNAQLPRGTLARLATLALANPTIEKHEQLAVIGARDSTITLSTMIRWH